MFDSIAFFRVFLFMELMLAVSVWCIYLSVQDKWELETVDDNNSGHSVLWKLPMFEDIFKLLEIISCEGRQCFPAGHGLASSSPQV